jgi:hypothetical protein
MLFQQLFTIFKPFCSIRTLQRKVSAVITAPAPVYEPFRAYQVQLRSHNRKFTINLSHLNANTNFDSREQQGPVL